MDQIQRKRDFYWKLYGSFGKFIISFFEIVLKAADSFSARIKTDMLFVPCEINHRLSFISESGHLIPNIFFTVRSQRMNKLSQFKKFFLYFYWKEEDILINVFKGIFHILKIKKVLHYAALSPFTFYFFPISPGTGYIKKGREFFPTLSFYVTQLLEPTLLLLLLRSRQYLHLLRSLHNRLRLFRSLYKLCGYRS